MEKDKNFTKMAITEIRSHSDFLADRIRDMITSGELAGGFGFPNENEFCRQLSVSRGTLREAYKILDTQGFIQRTKHGTYVRERSDIAEEGNFSASLELADYREMVEFVCALEPEAVYLAAEKADELQIEKLQRLMEACEEAVSDSKLLLEQNYAFHAYIRSIAGNHLIRSALTAYYDIFNQQVIGGIYAKNQNLDAFKVQSLRSHRELFEAIRVHDAKKARKIAYDHLINDLQG